MPTSTWGGPEPGADATYPKSLLKHLLQQAITHFEADGGCIALYDDQSSQMRVRLHLRMRNLFEPEEITRSQRAIDPNVRKARVTAKLSLEAKPPVAPINSNSSFAVENMQEVTPEESELFAPGMVFPRGHDLIGCSWHRNEIYTLTHEDYLLFLKQRELPFQVDITPAHYFVLPISEVRSPDPDQRMTGEVLGVIVLYRVSPTASGFQSLRAEALQYTERIALYLQNQRLRRNQRRTSEYLQWLQEISTAFPNSVKLSDLIENMYQFVTNVVDVSSMLLTLYDRDLDRLYDVFALKNGERIANLAEQPLVRLPNERPVWWRLTQQERRTLLFSPVHNLEKAQEYQELLMGVWGDQRQAQQFLLLPMKMFTRVIGALSIVSDRPVAYRPEEIQVLETMAQIVAVNIENAKLYERDRRILADATQREAHLAAINSALQVISSELNVSVLLQNLVESVAETLKVEMCVFLQPSPDQDVLVAQALYAPSSVQMFDDGTGLPTVDPPTKGKPDDLITTIQIPFKNTFLEHMANGGFFYLDPSQLEELAVDSTEAGAIFLRETNINSLLMIPMTYHTEFFGFLGVPTPPNTRMFRPKQVGTLLAICAQAAGAIRNAQLFAQREEAYAEMERLNKLKDEFLVTASHELRTPLTAISGYASQLKRQALRANPQQILRFATKISMASQQLTYLVGTMTEAAQIGVLDKNIHMNLEPIQLKTACDIAINMLTYNADHVIIREIDPQLWVIGDAPRLRQALTNLLENAAKYSPAATVIRVTAHKMTLAEIEVFMSEDQIDHALLVENGDMPVVLLRVIDQGEGVLPDDQLRIFEKFVRATRSLTTPVRGSGLGLYISRRLVEAMGGKLWLERSMPDEGSTFSFYLPWIETPAEAMGE